MLGNFGFSYIGVIYLLMLWIPNAIWAKCKPEGYDPSSERKVLLVFERIGQVLCTATILLFTNYNPRSIEPWTVWFIASAALMILYEVFWLRYFRSKQTVADFYRPIFGIPVPGAALPVAAARVSRKPREGFCANRLVQKTEINRKNGINLPCIF